MDREITAEARKDIEDLIPGTSGHYDYIITRDHGLGEDAIEAAMRDLGHFRCAQCGWWCEDSEENDRDGESVCNDCHEDAEEE